MIRKMTMWAIMALLVVAVAAPVAFAASPAEEACLAQNDPANGITATYERVGPGQYECVVTEPVNPSGNDNPNAATPFTDVQEDSQKGQGGGGGETTNKHFTEDDAVKNPAGHEPAGQQ